MNTNGMQQLQDGEFIMGSERFYPEERPRRHVRVDPFVDRCNSRYELRLRQVRRRDGVSYTR